MESLTAPAYRTISNHGIAEMRRKLSNGQNALFILRSYQPGDIIANFSIGQGYKGAVNIVLKTNCDNFFIPNNVFDFDDSVRSL